MTTETLAHGLADAVRRCREAQAEWACVRVRQRLGPVRRLRRLLAAESARLCDAVAADIGKSPDETLAGDVLPLAEACRFLGQQAVRLLRPRRVPLRHRPLWLWGQSDTVHRRPRGVVGIIGTWNYPLFLNGVQSVQALTAGNAVVWKPSEVAPRSAAALFELFAQAGYPKGLIHRMEPTRAGGPELAAADVDHVVFTGSAATGRVLARQLGERLVSSTLELSGCDAMFVLPDADASLAARAAWFGATLNHGQTCLAVRRAFVHRSLYPAFIDALKPLAAAAAGPLRLASGAQAEHAARLINEALEEGAELLTGRERADAAALRPAVVVAARPEMSLCHEDSFAPVLAVLPFDSWEEALRMNAGCRYGLAASVFSRDAARAARLAGQLPVGSVTVNDVIVAAAHPATPFGGRGTSGWGVTQGAEGLLEMTVPQVVSVSGGSFRPHYDFAAGAGPVRGDLARGLLEWGHGATLGQQWRGLWRLLRGLWPRSRAADPPLPRE